MLSLGIIALIHRAPRISDARTQSIFVIVISFAIWVGYSLLLSIFKIKNGGYPFALPPFL
jgi:oligosaccharyltransferase complex subunit gamma